MNLPLIIRNETVRSRNPNYIMCTVCAMLPVLGDVRDSKVNGGQLIKLILELNLRDNHCCFLFHNDVSLLLNFRLYSLVHLKITII